MTPLVFKSFLVILALFGASVYVWDNSAQRKIRALQGHWHSDTKENVTLDVIDTLVIVNRYSRITAPDTLSIIDRELGRVVLPIHCGCGGPLLMPEMSRFTVDGGMLTYDSITSTACYPFRDMHFKGCDPASCHLNHALEPYTGPIKFGELPVGAGEMNSKVNHSFFGLILIGFPSEEEFRPGPMLQVNNVWISPDGLPQWFDSERARGENQVMNFIWVIDATVPKIFLEEAFQYVPQDSSSHYQLVMSEDKSQIGYRLMDDLQ